MSEGAVLCRRPPGLLRRSARRNGTPRHVLPPPPKQIWGCFFKKNSSELLAVSIGLERKCLFHPPPKQIWGCFWLSPQAREGNYSVIFKIIISFEFSWLSFWFSDASFAGSAEGVECGDWAGRVGGRRNPTKGVATTVLDLRQRPCPSTHARPVARARSGKLSRIPAVPLDLRLRSSGRRGGAPDGPDAARGGSFRSPAGGAAPRRPPRPRPRPRQRRGRRGGRGAERGPRRPGCHCCYYYYHYQYYYH